MSRIRPLWVLSILWIAGIAASFASTGVERSGRFLVVGDFNEVNEVVKDAVVSLPDMSSSGMALTNVECTSFDIGNVQLSSRKTNERTVAVNLEVTALSMYCEASYHYTAFLINNRGTVKIWSTNSDASLDGYILSSEYATTPPSGVTVGTCDPTVRFSNIDFTQGGLIGLVLNTVERLLRSLMERLVETRLCEELQNALEDVEGFLETADITLESYTPQEFDPLQLESDLRLPAGSNITLLNLLSQQTQFGRWVDTGLTQAVKFLQKEVRDETANRIDLRANQLIRDNLLTDGSLILSGDELPIPEGLVMEEHNSLFDISLQLDKAKLTGLDSLSQIEPLEKIGLYTMRNQLQWDFLALELDATITVLPSTLPGAIVSAPNSTSVLEKVKIVFTAEDLSADVSVIAAINQDLLEGIRVGSLLQKDSLADCLLSTIFKFELSTFGIGASNIVTPTLSGFVSPGLDRVFTEAMDTVFLMYEQILLRSSPTFFQNDIRPIINQQMSEELERGGRCAPFGWAPHQVIDLRDLFLPATDAIAAGGAGKEPYGDLISGLIFPGLKEQVMDVESFNENYVRKFTKQQSGIPGTLSFEETFVSYKSDVPSKLYDRFEFQVSKLFIQNLDTITAPLDLMNPRDWNLLHNKIALGSDNPVRHLNVSITVLLVVGGEDSPFNMDNEMDFSLSLPSTTLALGLLASLKESSLLNFPLSDLTNPYCWLAALANEDEAHEYTGDQPLDLSTFAFNMTSFSLNSKCISCSSPGADFVSTVLTDLSSKTVGGNLNDMLVALTEDTVWSLWGDVDVHALMEIAPRLCPHRPEYAVSTSAPDLVPTLASLSTESMETVFTFAVLALEAAIVVASKNALMSDLSSSGDSVPENDTISQLPSDVDIVNWIDLDGEYGELASYGLDGIRGYIREPVKSDLRGDLRHRSLAVTPRANNLVQDYLLDGDGSYTFPMERMQMEVLAAKISIDKIKILGLDSITKVEVLQPAAATVFSNEVTFGRLAILVDIEMDVNGTTTSSTLSYGTSDLDVTIDLHVEIDSNQLGKVRLGSLFDTKNELFACASSAIYNAEIASLSVQMRTLEGPDVVGLVAPETQSTVSSIAESALGQYNEDVMAGIAQILDTVVKDSFNILVPDLLEAMRNECKKPPQINQDELVDFRELLLVPSRSTDLNGNGLAPYGDLFVKLYGVLNEKVLQTGASNRPLINDVFRTISERQSNMPGDFNVEGTVIQTQGNIQLAGLNADVMFTVSNLTLENVDSIGDPLDLFRPVSGEPNTLRNVVSFGVDGEPMRMGGQVVFAVSDGEDLDIHNTLELSLSVENVVIMADVLLRVSASALSQFPLRDLSNANCWLATVLAESNDKKRNEALPSLRGIGLVDQVFSIGNFSFDVNCESCSSPDFDEFLLSLYTPDNATELENNIQSTADRLLNATFLPSLLDKVVDVSSQKCPHHSRYNPNATSSSFLSSSQDSFGLGEFVKTERAGVYFNVANSILAGLIFLSGVLLRRHIHRRNEKWIQSLSREGELYFRRQQHKEAQMQTMLDHSTSSMLSNPQISARVRFGVPLAIVVNILLYIGGHIGTLSVVMVDASVAGEPFSVNNFLKFSFLQSTTRTFQNGGAEMAVLMWIFTGIWPYVKLVVSLGLWATPPTYLSVERRGTYLLWLDALARLSVIDIFTMLLGFAVLLVFIGGPDEVLDVDGVMYSLKGIIVPRSGFYCIVVAQRMSRVSSRFLLDYHDKMVQLAKANCDKESSSSETTGSDDDSAIYAPGSVPSSEGQMESRRHGGHEAVTEDNSHHADFVDVEVSSSGQPQNGEIETVLDTTSSKKDTKWTIENLQEHYGWGTIGVIFAAVSILVVFIIGCIFAPAISLDVSSLGGVSVESNLNYQETVSAYGVFLVLSAILLKARFVLATKADYVGFGLLLVAGLISFGMMFFIKVLRFIKLKLAERQESHRVKTPEYGHKGCGLPSYLRLNKWKHVEIYLISVAIGIWQLGSIASFAIYQYCEILQHVYFVMASVGLVEETSAQCYKEQVQLPGNLVIIMGALLILVVSFLFQIRAQIKRNNANSLQWIADEDVPRYSLLWSKDRSKNSKYSHLTASLSAELENLSEEDFTLDTPTTPSTQASSIPGTPLSDRRFATRFASPNEETTMSPNRAIAATALFETPPGRYLDLNSRSNRSIRFADEDDSDDDDGWEDSGASPPPLPRRILGVGITPRMTPTGSSNIRPASVFGDTEFDHLASETGSASSKSTE